MSSPNRLASDAALRPSFNGLMFSYTCMSIMPWMTVRTLAPSHSSRGTTASDIATNGQMAGNWRRDTQVCAARGMEVSREERSRKLRLKFTPPEMLRDDGSLNPECAPPSIRSD